MTENHLDLTGLSCPLPVLRTSRALRCMQPGERLRVVADDRAARHDFPLFCRETGHILLASDEADGQFRFLIQRRG